MPILNYTTSINENKTCAAICSMLSKKGAHRIVQDYEKGTGKIIAISFAIELNGSDIYFNLPANWQGVQKALKKQTRASKYLTEAHARNVTWRIIKDWIEAQCAIVEAEQADMATVFLPYAMMTNRKTISENFHSAEGRNLLLNEG